MNFCVDTESVARCGLTDVPTYAPAIYTSAGYDATESRGRRRAPLTTTMAEDRHADERRRIILSANARDLARNFAIASWAIRKHVSFVADFTFQAKTPDPAYNAYLEQWWADRTQRRRFDVAHRHNWRRAVRLAEACKTIDGDVGWLKLAPPVGDPNRGRIQPTEADRIFMPRGSVPAGQDPEDWVNGARVDRSTGRVLEYALCRRRGRTGRELERIVPERNLNLLSAYEFRYDQIRGISPIAAAINHFRDTYEGFDLAFAKLKVGQMFGVQITTDGGAETGPIGGDYQTDADGDGVADAEPRINLHRGPYVVELDAGEKADVIESKTPSSETVAFLKLVIHVALRALDIPFSFFDESFTNFYGSRGSLIQYLHSCHDKVLELLEFLYEHARWAFGLAVVDEELELPSGKDFSYLAYEFIPGGIPWWDSTKEVRGAAMGVAAGFTSPQRVCQEIGTNFEQNIREIAAARKFAADLGVDLVYADSTAFAPEITVEANGHD